MQHPDGHLFLSPRGCVDFAGGATGYASWYDAAHHSVLLFSSRSRSLQQVMLDASVDPIDVGGDDDSTRQTDKKERSTREPNAASETHRVSVLYQFDRSREVSMPPIETARLSVDGQFLALQTSDIEVQVIHLATRETYWVLCKTKGGNSILESGVLWSTHSSSDSRSQDLFLVTKHGVEQYRVSSKRRNCRLHRTISSQIHAYWYAPSHDTLVVSAGSRGTELVTFRLRGSSVVKLPRLVFSSPVLQQDLFLAPMYDALYAVYSDMRTSKLLLYLIGRSKVTCARSLNFMLPPGTALKFSVVDNLLVCHSLDFNVSLFFDVHCDGTVNDPFSAPLPVSSAPPGRHDGVTDTCALELIPESHPLKVDQGSNHSSGSIASHSRDDADESNARDENDDANTFDQYVRSLRRATSADNLNTHYVMDEVLEVPIVPPAPTSNPVSLPQRSVHSLPRAMTVDEDMMKHSETQAHRRRLDSSFDKSVFSRWQFLALNLVQRSSLTTTGMNGRSGGSAELVQVRKLQVNLLEICRSAAHHREIIPFLLRRGDDQLAKKLALKLIRDHIVEQALQHPAITSLLSLVQTLTARDTENVTISRGHREDAKHIISSDGAEDDEANTHSSAVSSIDPLDSYGSAGSRASREVPREALTSTIKSSRADASGYKIRRPPARNTQGFIHIFQSDILRHVWHPLLQDSTFVKTGKLSIYITEYVKNLRRNGVPVESITYVALAQAFIEAGEPQKLYQYLHYHVLSDSRDLADVLVRHGSQYPSLMQVGLDMYFRLGDINSLVFSLLDIGETDRAISISWRNLSTKNHNAFTIPAAVFFDSCVRSLTSSDAVSRFHASMKLHNLLLFLRVWDPDSLLCSHPSCSSRLAQTAMVPFPDYLVPDNHRNRFRSEFGFPLERR